MSSALQLLTRFRQVAIIEGISFLVLLFIAMPLKYGLGLDWTVKIVGWAHGILFIAYCYYLTRCWLALRWTLLFTALAFVAALIPFGTFVLDRRLPEPALPA